MADRYSYLQYKRDTRYLLFWMIHAANSIIKSSPQSSSEHEVNTTGQLAISSIVPVSQLIAKHVNPIPSTIFRLFESIIGARSAAYAVFQQMVLQNPDPEIEKNNASHKRFIEILTEAFTALGGDVWAEKQKTEKEPLDKEDVNEIVFANTFSTLTMGQTNEEEESGNEESNQLPRNAATNRTRKKPSGKGKKGKGGKKGRDKPKAATKEPDLDEVPLESYRIIEDENGIVTDYLMAVYSTVQEWVQLRRHLQGVWREVAYGGLNSAVAGELSNIAIAMVKQTESTIFVEFPGHDSFETIMNTITRGNIEKAMGNFVVSLHRLGADNSVAEKVRETHIDIREEFFIHTYQALLDFVKDFQLNRSGKPTKRMLSELNNWDPNLDLQQASKEERIKWRRVYTINWLYDLVNVFSSIVIQRINLKGQKWVLETVDWSTSGPWNEHRRLFGLNEFAGEITSLAMQKPNTDVRLKIHPHTVFQLQCIVDSLTVSRGWSLGSFRHILHTPAHGFRPRRDVDLFLDRENKNFGRGYCNGVEVLKQLFERDAMIHGDEKRHQQISQMLVEIQEDFINWLGESKYMYGLTTIPPSRFSNTNANGLWEYSPFLCGVGLMEALELAYSMSFLMMDRIPEPFCVIHLHNMLVQKGYIAKEIGLYASLQQLFPDTFFANGKAPTSNFGRAFRDTVGESASNRATFRRRTIGRTAARTNADIHGLLDEKMNYFFKRKSILGLYREANWIPDRIPDEDVPFPSVLGILRIGQTKYITDPTTGNKVLEDTVLVRRARSYGLSEEEMIEMATRFHSIDPGQPISEAILRSLPEGYWTAPSSRQNAGSSAGNAAPSGTDLLYLLKTDIVNDISGSQPVLSLNYVWVVATLMMKFMDIEEKLKELRNPVWVEAYERNPFMTKEKRLSLTAQVLASEDEECMEVIAGVFQNPRSGFMQHIYWEDLDESEKMMDKDPLNQNGFVEHNCTLM